MSLEKLGILFLLNYFNQLGTVRDHVMLAVKEILMAVQASISILSQSTTKTVLGNRMEEVLNPVMGRVQNLLDYTIEKITPSGPTEEAPNLKEGMKLKEHIVSSIISAIDDEIENTRSTTSEQNKLKVEALHTVKEVLMNQKNKPMTQIPTEINKTRKTRSRVA